MPIWKSCLDHHFIAKLSYDRSTAGLVAQCKKVIFNQNQGQVRFFTHLEVHCVFSSRAMAGGFAREVALATLERLFSSVLAIVLF